MSMALRVGTWNLAYRGRKTAAVMAQLVETAKIDVLTLQEAHPAALPVIVELGGFDWVRTAYDAGASRHTGRSTGPRVTAIAGLGHEPEELHLLEDVAFPAKALIAVVPTPAGQLSVASYHAPPGVRHGIVKVQHAHALRDWIDRTPGPIVVGADANTPEIDHPDVARVRTHWHSGGARLEAGMVGDEVVFGGAPTHRLRDALRLWLEEHPRRLDEIRRLRPDGPLEISHRVGQGKSPRRYDALWVSDDFHVDSVRYDYQEAVQAGSDHALVVASLSHNGVPRT